MDTSRVVRRLIRIVTFQSLVLIAIVAALIGSCATTSTQRPGPLRVTEMVVVDPKGVERVRIGGDLPDAIIGGKRVPRGEKAAGVLLYDGSGQERGGYVTWEPSGNVGLTLDSRKGQSALFVSGPDPGSALQLWYGKDVIELRSDEDGSRLTAVKDREVVIQQPPIVAMIPETCAEYRQAGSRVSAEQILRDCRRRFTDAACRACLGEH